MRLKPRLMGAPGGSDGAPASGGAPTQPPPRASAIPGCWGAPLGAAGDAAGADREVAIVVAAPPTDAPPPARPPTSPALASLARRLLQGPAQHKRAQSEPAAETAGGRATGTRPRLAWRKAAAPSALEPAAAAAEGGIEKQGPKRPRAEVPLLAALFERSAAAPPQVWQPAPAPLQLGQLEMAPAPAAPQQQLQQHQQQQPQRLSPRQPQQPGRPPTQKDCAIAALAERFLAWLRRQPGRRTDTAGAAAWLEQDGALPLHLSSSTRQGYGW